MRSAFELLQQVDRGEMPFDRALQVAVSDGLEKHQIQGRMPHHLKTLEALIELNSKDYKSFVKSSNEKRKRAIWQRLTSRRRRCVRLIEELGIRIEFIEPMFHDMRKMAKEADSLNKRIRRIRKPAEKAALRAELEAILAKIHETAEGLAERNSQLNNLHRAYERA